MAKEPRMRELVVLNQKPLIGPNTCSFQVTPEGMRLVADEITTNAFGQFKMDGRIVREMLEEFLQGVVKEKFEMLNGDKIVADIVERRVEVAIKRASEGLERELLELAKTALRKRLTEEVAKMPLTLKIEGEGN
jgi:hypothetical protein